MTPSSATRSKAARLRRKATKKRLTPAERRWLDTYERGDTEPPPPPTDAPSVTLAWSHVVEPQTDRIEPADTWQPTVSPPPLPDGAEPASPPPEGAPPVEGEPREGESVLGAPPAVPDPGAADQFAAIIGGIITLGFYSAREILKGVPLPAEVAMLAGSEAFQMRATGVVCEAARRIAIKYSFREVPLADEVLVAAPCALSVLLASVVARRMLSTKSKQPEATQAQPEEATDIRLRRPSAPGPEAQTRTPGAPDINSLFSRNRA